VVINSNTHPLELAVVLPTFNERANIAPMVTRTNASPFAACGWRATVVTSLRGEVVIVVMMNLVLWMLYEIFGSLKSLGEAISELSLSASLRCHDSSRWLLVQSRSMSAG